MKKIAWASALVTVCLLVFIPQVNAATVTVENVPYINQVEHMDQNYFLGYNACGPTSAVMITEFHKLQPENTSGYPGWYVYNPYTNWTDKSGEDYNEEWARDWDGIDAPNTYNLHFPHEVYGAHGFIVTGPGADSANPYWGTDPNQLKLYLENHGLIVSDAIYSDRFDIIKQNIDAGLPLIGHAEITISSIEYGHYLVIIGYDTGVNGTEQNVIVHDPYGNANGNWFDTVTGGEEVTYPLYGYTATSHVNIDRVYTVHPVGIFQDFPGWKLSGQDPLSQLFLDEYDNEEYYGNSGLETFGLPWDNDGHGVWVHEWPDPQCSTTPPATCDDDGLYVQDFLRVDAEENEHWSQLVLNWAIGKAIAVKEHILEFWNGHYGYSAYGPPVTREYETVIDGNHTAVEQLFEIDGVKTMIGYDLDIESAYEFTLGAPGHSELNPSDSDASWFGWSIGVSGDIMLVGDPRFVYKQRGALFVFAKGANGWEEVEVKDIITTYPDYGGYENYGSAVAIDGANAIVGAWQRDGDIIGQGHSAYSDVGAVYFYTCSSNGCTQVGDEFLGQDGSAGENLGQSVEISGDMSIAGAPRNDSAASNAGAAYIFHDSGHTVVTASNGEANAYFGTSVAIDGNYAVVGAHKHGAYDQGAVYFFEYDESTETWSETDYFVGDYVNCVYVGQSVSISGNYALVGSTPKSGKAGRALLFRRDAATGEWDKINEITAENGYIGDGFGQRVALDGNRAVVSSYLQKRFWAFLITGDVYSQIASVYESFASNYFGKDAVAIDGFTAITGEINADSDGAIHVYDLYIEPDYE